MTKFLVHTCRTRHHVFQGLCGSRGAHSTLRFAQFGICRGVLVTPTVAHRSSVLGIHTHTNTHTISCCCSAPNGTFRSADMSIEAHVMRLSRRQCPAACFLRLVCCGPHNPQKVPIQCKSARLRRNVVYWNTNGRSSMISCAIKSFKRHSQGMSLLMVCVFVF